MRVLIALLIGPFAVIGAVGCRTRSLPPSPNDGAVEADPADLEPSPRDLALADFGTSDLSNVDLAVADLASASDLATPADLTATADLATPADVATGDLAMPPDLMGSPPKRIFLTSQLFAANLGGLAGADAICQRLANAAALTGTYKAWLSDSTVSAAERLTHAAVPYVRVDGYVVAQNWTALTSGQLMTIIDATESGALVSLANGSCSYGGGVVQSLVWTNTQPDGSIASTLDSCANWTATTGLSGPLGTSWTYGPGWTDTGCYGSCSMTAPLYCLEQ